MLFIDELDVIFGCQTCLDAAYLGDRLLSMILKLDCKCGVVKVFFISYCVLCCMHKGYTILKIIIHNFECRCSIICQEMIVV